MDAQQHARMVSFIWNIADDVLGDALNRTESLDAFMQREVLPNNPDVRVVDGSEKVGYEINLAHYCYKPQQLRTLTGIVADIRALEAETRGVFEETLVEVEVDSAPAMETV